MKAMRQNHEREFKFKNIHVRKEKSREETKSTFAARKLNGRILEGEEQQLLLQAVERKMREEQQSFYKQLRERWRSKKQQLMEVYGAEKQRLAQTKKKRNKVSRVKPAERHMNLQLRGKKKREMDSLYGSQLKAE